MNFNSMKRVAAPMILLVVASSKTTMKYVSKQEAIKENLSNEEC